MKIPKSGLARLGILILFVVLFGGGVILATSIYWANKDALPDRTAELNAAVAKCINRECREMTLAYFDDLESLYEDSAKTKKIQDTIFVKGMREHTQLVIDANNEEMLYIRRAIAILSEMTKHIPAN